MQMCTCHAWCTGTKAVGGWHLHSPLYPTTPPLMPPLLYNQYRHACCPPTYTHARTHLRCSLYTIWYLQLLPKSASFMFSAKHLFAAEQSSIKHQHHSTHCSSVRVSQAEAAVMQARGLQQRVIGGRGAMR